jgi:hypothetical protein
MAVLFMADVIRMAEAHLRMHLTNLPKDVAGVVLGLVYINFNACHVKHQVMCHPFADVGTLVAGNGSQ